MRQPKAPTRRQIAQKTLQTIAVVNATSQGLDAIHARVSQLEAWQQTEQALTRWQRFWRVVGG